MAKMADTEVTLWRNAARMSAIREAIVLADRTGMDGIETRQLIREVINLEYNFPKDAISQITGKAI